IGAADLSVARIYEGHLNALFLLHQFADDEQKQFWFDEAEAGKIFGVWNTEAANGIKFTRGNGSISITGAKTFCSGSTNIDYPIITGQLEDEGWQMAIIDMKSSGLGADASFWNPLGMRSSVSHRIDFAGHELTKKNLLGIPGNYYRQPGFGGGAIRFSAVQVGGAQAILDGTIDYLRQMGRTDDQFQKQRVSEMAILVKSGLQWIDSAGLMFENGMGDEGKNGELLNMANMMRHAVEEICNRVMQLSEKCVGARGLMKPGRLERIHRDLRYYLRQPAPDATFISIGDYILTSNKSSDDIWN
ncbi:MAG: acyl-CoA dehydrogenase, partial [Chitinophagaceae bacterium]